MQFCHLFLRNRFSKVYIGLARAFAKSWLQHPYIISTHLLLAKRFDENMLTEEVFRIKI